MELDELLERTMGVMGRVIAGVPPAQLSAPTPCTEWDVRAVMNHVIGGNHFFAATAAGEEPPMPAEPRDLVGDDPATAYGQGAKAALEAWRAPGTAERMVNLPIGTMPGAFAIGIHALDHTVHAWDIAKATGQVDLLDQEVAEAAYGYVNGNISDQLREPGGPFGPEVEAPTGCSPAERLAAYMGRTP